MRMTEGKLDKSICYILNNKYKSSVNILLLVMTIIIISLLVNNVSLKKENQLLIGERTPNKTRDMELGYFEGQKDYMHGDIRIKQTDKDYVFTRSPWDGEKEPYFWSYKKYTDEYYWWKK